MIASVNKTNELLNKYNLKAKKRLGQNFLIDGNVVRKIVEKAGIDKNTGVIEIGPGLGSMTEVLVQNANKVLAFEIDPDMINILSNELKDYSNLKIINKDILKSDINSELDYFDGLERIIVVSNLPYYITTPIVSKLLEVDKISLICVMVQKEVAVRFCAKPNSRDYGSLTVMINLKTDVETAFDVSRNCFMPRPNVDSAILLMKVKKMDCRLNNEPKFLNFIKNSFAMKRKTFINNILASYSIDRGKVIEILSELNFDENVRSESIDLEGFIGIYNKLFEG